LKDYIKWAYHQTFDHQINIKIIYIMVTKKNIHIHNGNELVRYSKMEIQCWVWMYTILFSLLASYFLLRSFMWRLNEWYYNMILRKKQYPLPPGHLGWPLIGNMLTFFKHFSYGHPNSFINNFISKSLSFSLPFKYNASSHIRMHSRTCTFGFSIFIN
jgi:hypothetical protein